MEIKTTIAREQFIKKLEYKRSYLEVINFNDQRNSTLNHIHIRIIYDSYL